MKTINVTFEDEEFEQLIKFKEPKESWQRFILRKIVFKVDCDCECHTTENIPCQYCYVWHK